MKPLLSVKQRMQRKKQLRDLLTDINEQVAHLPRPVLRELAPIIRQAEAEATKHLRLLLDGKRGDTFDAQKYRNAIVQLRKAQEAMTPVSDAIRKGMKRALPGSVHLATGHIKTSLIEFSAFFEGTMRHIPLQVASVMAQTEKLMIPRFRTSAKRYLGHVGVDFGAMKRELVSGFVQGENFGQMATRLQRYGGPRGLVATRGVIGEPGAVIEEISEGLFARHRYFAERIVRTETIRGYNAAADFGIAELHAHDERIVRRWDAALDARTCVECRLLDGRTAEPGGEFLPGVMDAPLHPNCRCATIAWRDDWDDEAMSKRANARDPEAPDGRAEKPIE